MLCGNAAPSCPLIYFRGGGWANLTCSHLVGLGHQETFDAESEKRQISCSEEDWEVPTVAPLVGGLRIV